MRRLYWSITARRDLARIGAWFDDLRPGLGDEMMERLERFPAVLLEHPAIGSPTRKPGLRKWTIRKTPFLIFYSHTAYRIEVRRVFHAAQDRPY